MILSENEAINQKNSSTVLKSPYHQEEQTNRMGRRMKCERQVTTLTEKAEKLRPSLLHSIPFASST